MKTISGHGFRRGSSQWDAQSPARSHAASEGSSALAWALQLPPGMGALHWLVCVQIRTFIYKAKICIKTELFILRAKDLIRSLLVSCTTED